MPAPDSGHRVSSRWSLVVLAAALWSSGGVMPLFAGSPPPQYSVPGGFFDHPVTYREDSDHFKYGSVGGERGYNGQVGFGLPYWIWVALPELFAEHLPGKASGRGYAGFGYIYEAGRDPRFHLPIGTSQRRNVGLDRVWINCGVCHTGTYRKTPRSEPEIVLGMPANRYNQGAWVKFLFDSAVDEKFTGERLVMKIRQLEKERRHLIAQGKLAGASSLPPELSPLEEEIFKLFVVPVMRKRLLAIRDRMDWVQIETWGPGRVDTWNAPKALLNFPMEKALPEEKLGNADLPSVWNQKAREGMQLHWVGNNTSLHERNLSAVFASTIPPTLDKCSLRRVARFLETLEPPPFPEKIDQALAARGAPIYNAYCARCHGGAKPPFRGAGGGEELGTVVPLERIGTDRSNFDSYTPELVRAQNGLYAQYPLANSRGCPDDPEAKAYPARFTHFRKTDGYANSPLDGVWLRAPYLHNGSVPTLRALLEPSTRPEQFWRGYDVYDFRDVGFVTDGPEARAQGWRYDTTLPGNGNRGHEGPEYGTELAPDEKDALIEYLKTF